jgi:ribosome biogenesis protein SSF1/2
MNNFSTQPKDDTPAPVPKHLESLVTTMFQSLLPPLNPQKTPLGSVKRVLLLNREPPTDPANNAYTVTLRHYTISSKVTGIPKPLKRLNQAEGGEKKERRGKGLPNLGKLEDVSEYLLAGEMGDAGNYTSASESEPDTDAEVEVLASTTRKVLNRSKHQKEMAKAATDAAKGGKRPGVEKRAIKLTELGPRMRLRLIKVEEGLCGGKIMWHDHVQKSAAEQKELEKKWEHRRLEKEERKRIQRENVERKKKERGAGKEGDDEEEEEDDEDEENGGDYDIDDDEYWDSDVSAEEGGAEDDEDEEMEDGG